MIALLSVLSLLTMLWIFWSLIGLIYPVRPFATRRRAARSFGTALAASFVIAVAVGMLDETAKSPGQLAETNPTPSSSSAEAATTPATAEAVVKRSPAPGEVEPPKKDERRFVEDDFYWDEDTSKFKEPIITVVNRIARENKSCGVIDPSSVAKSSSRSKPGDPVFFVTCGEGSDVFNVWFRPGDASREEAFAATVPLGRAEAAAACERAAKQAAAHPSTVDFSRFLDLAYIPYASGRARIVSSFTAQNSFGLELEYTIDCLFEGGTMIETVILEAAD